MNENKNKNFFSVLTKTFYILYSETIYLRENNKKKTSKIELVLKQNPQNISNNHLSNQ